MSLYLLPPWLCQKCSKKIGLLFKWTATYHLRLCLSAYSGSNRTNAKETLKKYSQKEKVRFDLKIPPCHSVALWRECGLEAHRPGIKLEFVFKSLDRSCVRLLLPGRALVEDWSRIGWALASHQQIFDDLMKTWFVIIICNIVVGHWSGSLNLLWQGLRSTIHFYFTASSKFWRLVGCLKSR